MAAPTEPSGYPKSDNTSTTCLLAPTLQPFVPPNSSDVRSPCPALNALANHGYINHDGKNLTITALVNAVQRVYNLSKPLAYLLAVTGVLLCGNGRTVDLFHLAKHGVIEHDASLSRADTQPPHKYAPTDPDPEVVDQLMHTTSHNFLVLKDFALARVSRELKAIGGPLDSIHAEIGRAESSLILQVFGGETGEVDKEVLRTWFIDGRLPDSYKIPEHVVGIFSTRSLGGRIAEAMKSIRNPGPV